MVLSEHEKAVIESHADLVARVARAQHRRLRGAVELDDLTSWGFAGLIRGVQLKSEEVPELSGGDLENYLAVRVRGAMLDEMRRRDPLSRAARAVSSAAPTPGRTEAERATDLGVSLGDLRKLEREVDEHGTLGTIEQASEVAQAVVGDPQSILLSWFDGQEELTQQVLALKYFERLSLEEVAQALGEAYEDVAAAHRQGLLDLLAHTRSLYKN